MKGKKKIAIVVNTYPKLSETFIKNKVCGLIDAGFDVTVYTTDRTVNKQPNSGGVDVVRINDIRIIVLNVLKNPVRALVLLTKLTKRYKGIDSLRYFRKVFMLLLGNNDIIHFEFSGIATGYIGCIDLLKPAKIYVSCRGTAEIVKPIVDHNRKMQLTDVFNMVDRIHCVSKAMADLIIEYGADSNKIFINRPAVNDAFIRCDNTILYHSKKYNSKLVITSVGRLNFQKGYIYALLAIKEISKNFDDFEYNIIGGGEDMAEIMYFIDKNNLKDLVKIHGAKANADILEKLKETDIFLLTSVYEGIANAVLEAMAMGVPVVSTRAGGMDEVIIDGENGLLADCFDHTSVKEALLKFIVNQNNAAIAGYNGRKTILNNFTMGRQIDCYIKEYNNVI